MSGLADEVHVDPAVLGYVAELAEESRRQPHVKLGLSARGCLAFVRAAKTWAAADGRDHVVPDDIKELAEPVLCHRLLLDAEAQFSGVDRRAVIARLLDSVAAAHGPGGLTRHGENPDERLPRLLGVVNPLGWTVLAVGVGRAAVAAPAGWLELAVLAAACLLLLVLRAAVPARPHPGRGRAGAASPRGWSPADSVAASVDVTNLRRRGLLPTMLELPVGAAVHRYAHAARWRAGAAHEETFTVRTQRRGVIAVGPATTRRGDPLGLFSPRRRRGPASPRSWSARRWCRWSRSAPGCCATSRASRPTRSPRATWPSTRCASTSPATTCATSTGAPRPRRWLGGESQLLVRQYLDTRRSHATIVVDDADRGLGRRRGLRDRDVRRRLDRRPGVTDDFEASFVCGDHASTGADGNLALDAVCRAELRRPRAWSRRPSRPP